MNARIAFILIAFASLSALSGCASTTPGAAAPSPVVAFAVPAARAAEAPGPSRFETTAYQTRLQTLSTRQQVASRH
ncbi:MAG TPA: hypothetical protein VF765_02705 [Polyangiaceae bacterium]